MSCDPHTMVDKAETTHEELAEWIRSYNYVRIVFTNGCFDVLHPGHLEVLKKCRELAGCDGAVVVGVNSDASVRRLKGPSRPIMDEKSRVQMVWNIKGVSFAGTFDEDTPLELIKALKPNIIVKGGDYRHDEVVGKEYADEGVVIVPRSTEWSTSSIISKINERP